MTDERLQVGDVVLDLCQGRPMQIIEAHDERAAAFSEDKSYDLLEVYGNKRLGTTAEDRVYECVYCSSLKNEPSRSYAFPESRLARVEVEAADDGRRLADRVVQSVLVELMTAFGVHGAAPDPEHVARGARYAGYDGDLVDEAEELADVAQRFDTDTE